MSKKSATKVSAAPSAKMTHREFVERSIKALAKPGYTSIHVVYSGFNNAFREYFGEDPRAIVDQLAKDGVITLRLAKGGALIALPGSQMKESEGTGAALAKILTQS